MKEVIYKYELEVTDEQVVEMPALAVILDIQVQNGKPCIWAKVNPLNETVKRKFMTAGTGNPIEFEACCYVATYQLSGGNFVFHVFEGH